MKNNKNNNLFKMFVFAFMLMLGVTSAYSAGGLNVVLSSQNPDPVSPGNFVYVNVKVSNSGSANLQDVNIELIENSNFQIAQGSDLSKNLGSIPAFSSLDTSTNFVIAKFKILVDDKTPLGLNTLEFEVVEGSQVYSYDFDILVQDANPSIRVSDFKIENIEPGKSSNLIVEVVNDNNVVLKNVIISLDLNEVEDRIFSTISGSNQKMIGVINPGQTKSIEYTIISDPSASSKSYNVPLVIEYDDALGNSFTSNGLGSVQVYSEPLLSIKLDSQDSLSGGSGKITLAVANPGTSTIKGTQIEILGSDDYEVLEGKFQYVGDLNPDDFQTVQADVFIKATSNTIMKMKVSYLDSYNSQNEMIVEVPIKVFSDAELKDLGLASSSSGSSSVSLIVTALIVGIVAFYFGRSRGFKKAKSKK